MTINEIEIIRVIKNKEKSHNDSNNNDNNDSNINNNDVNNKITIIVVRTRIKIMMTIMTLKIEVTYDIKVP